MEDQTDNLPIPVVSKKESNEITSNETRTTRDKNRHVSPFKFPIHEVIMLLQGSSLEKRKILSFSPSFIKIPFNWIEKTPFIPFL